MSREHMLWYVSGGGTSCTSATQGLPSETKLQVLSNTYNHAHIENKNTPVYVLWLKCWNLEGISGEHQELKSLGQGGRVSKKSRAMHPFRQTSGHSS
jgi:hypothetical protein